MTDPVAHLQTELAWAAGFFDGEGSVYLRSSNKRYPVKYACIAITQNDPEVLHRFVKAVGVYAAVNGPYDYKDGRSKPMYEIKYSTYAQIIAIRDAIYPFLSGVKRRQFDTVLDGARVPKVKNVMTEQQRSEIKNAYWQEAVTQRTLAACYGVSQSTIWRIVNG